MSGIDVRIARLEPMRVACVRVVSETPERDAWEALRAWAEPKGLLDDPQLHPVFGFNNPNPSPDRKEYGYEFWIRVAPDTASQGEIEVRDFPGGLYAVASCKLCGQPDVPQTWKMLWDWLQASPFRWRRTHELEKVQDPRAPEADLVLDLYLPVEERTPARDTG